MVEITARFASFMPIFVIALSFAMFFDYFLSNKVTRVLKYLFFILLAVSVIIIAFSVFASLFI